MRNKTVLKIITLILFIISLSLGIIGYKYKIDHPEILPYIVLGNKNGYEYMKIYKEINGEYCINENCEGELYLKIMSEMKEVELVAGNKNTKYLLISDEKLKLINIIDRTELIISEIPEGSYSLILEDGETYNQNNLGLEPLGIVFNTGKIKGFYNLNLNKIMYENIYDNITVMDKDFLIDTKENKITLLRINEEQEILEIDTEKDYATRKVEIEDEKAFITFSSYRNQNTMYKIYDLKTKSEIGEFEGVFDRITKGNNKIITLLDQEVIVYNMDGSIYQRREISASDKYNMIDNYYVTIQKGNLLLIDLETNEEKVLMEMDTYMHLDKMYKDVITENGKITQALRVVLREINDDGQITKTYNIYLNLETKEVKIEED